MLGESGLEVSRLCFGSLTMGPLQANLPLKAGAGLLCRAFRGGVNFVDTAEIYGTYPYIAEALKVFGGDIVVATKTYAYTVEQARKSLEKALVELKRECIDIFLLHEQESRLTLEGHRPALEYLFEEQKNGKIRAVGISCHTVAAVKAAFSFKEIAIIHPLFNIKGLGIKDGTVNDMSEALQEARKRGIGIYSMKPLGGGHLQNNAVKSLNFVCNFPFIDSVALGMRSIEEVEFALHFFRGEPIPLEIEEKISKKKRMIAFIAEDCTGCLTCVNTCPQNALKWENSQPLVIRNSCIWCGYCGAKCPGFCLRIV